MKKRSFAAILIAMIMIIMCSGFAFAEDGALQLVSSYPEDGQKNTSVENVGVKLYFNNEVDAEAVLAANRSLVKIVDDENNAIPIKVFAKGTEVLVVGDTTAEDYKVGSNQNYTLVIGEGFADNNGNTLGEETRITFRTFNQRANMTINSIMMFGMMGGVMVLSLKQAKDQNSEKKPSKEEETTGTFNPYREAKRTGKTVEEVIAEEKARREKAEKKAARKNRKAQAIREKLEEELDLSEELPYVYKVHKPRPISAAGSTHVSGRAKKKEPEETEKRVQSKSRAYATKSTKGKSKKK